MKKATYLKYEKNADHELIVFVDLETKEKSFWDKFRNDSNWLLLLSYYLKDLMNV